MLSGNGYQGRVIHDTMPYKMKKEVWDGLGERSNYCECVCFIIAVDVYVGAYFFNMYFVGCVPDVCIDGGNEEFVKVIVLRRWVMNVIK